MLDSRDIRNRAVALERRAFTEFWTSVVESAQLLKQIDPLRRKMWLSHVIEELYEKQQGLCALCGEPLFRGDHHVDHKIPFSYGGGNERGNIQLTHPACNLEKRTQVDPYDLLRYLEDRFMNLK